MSQRKAKRTRNAGVEQSSRRHSEFQSRRIKDVHAASEAARQTCGRLPGLVRFIHHLTDDALKGALEDNILFLLVAAQSASILDGNPNDGYGVEQDRLDDRAMENMRRILVGEHYRRIGLWRVRFPKHPLEESVTVCLYNHPFAKILSTVDGFLRQEVVEQLLRSGDLLQIFPTLESTLTPKELNTVLDEIEAFETQEPPFDPQATELRWGKLPSHKKTRDEMLEIFKKGRKIVAEMRKQGVAPLKRTECRNRYCRVRRYLRHQIAAIEGVFADGTRQLISEFDLESSEPSGYPKA